MSWQVKTLEGARGILSLQPCKANEAIHQPIFFLHLNIDHSFLHTLFRFLSDICISIEVTESGPGRGLIDGALEVPCSIWSVKPCETNKVWHQDVCLLHWKIQHSFLHTLFKLNF